MRYIVQRKLPSSTDWTDDGEFRSAMEAQQHIRDWSDYSDDDRDFRYYQWRVVSQGSAAL